MQWIVSSHTVEFLEQKDKRRVEKRKTAYVNETVRSRCSCSAVGQICKTAENIVLEREFHTLLLVVDYIQYVFQGLYYIIAYGLTSIEKKNLKN